MEEKLIMQIKLETLTHVLTKMFGKKITHTDYEAKPMHHTGKVQLVTGIARTDGGEKLPYNVVLKVQDKRESPGDPDLWRKEYDLYAADFNNMIRAFTASKLMPDCYHAEINSDETETQMWTEYIEGISGDGLTIEMFESMAAELGRFQGRIYEKQPQSLKNIACLKIIKRQETKEYLYIRSKDCAIPEDLRQTVVNNDVEMEKVLKNNKLPIVLCKGDFWAYNMIYSDGKMIHIDWERAKWGYICEDILELIGSAITPYSFEAFKLNIQKLYEYYRRLVGTYLNSFSKYADISQLDESVIWKLFITKLGYGVIGFYLMVESDEKKQEHIDELYRIYEFEIK